jgi:hypothetical protein
MRAVAVPVVVGLVVAAAAVVFSSADAGNSSGGTGSEIIDSGGTTPIPASGLGYLNLRHQDGARLLDYTNPQHPTIVSDGIYSFSMTAQCACAFQPSGRALFILGIGDVSVDQQFSLSTAVTTPRASGSLTWQADAGDEFGAVVFNSGTRTLGYEPIMGLLQKLG